MRSIRSANSFELSADPESSHWKGIPAVTADRDRYGRPVDGSHTEVRSRWTPSHLHFLFVCEYASMYLRPSQPETSETWGLWDWDVAEIFLGHDLANIQRYKEFEVSPRGEWVDLEVDRGRKEKQADWQWNSGFEVKTRVNEERKVWFAEVRIPWKAIHPRQPEAGSELRLNLYRIEGAPPNRRFMTWQPVHSQSFHTPKAFGRLQLVRD